ncbi:MAG TPA: hypothetical protein DCQ52_11795, partial [Acidimicrobiaceae bacterium]|nr:hypothetical protein [Acidimicrobiaceae bacterium]
AIVSHSGRVANRLVKSGWSGVICVEHGGVGGWLRSFVVDETGLSHVQHRCHAELVQVLSPTTALSGRARARSEIRPE